MPLAIMSFFGAPDGPTLTDAELETALGTGRSIARGTSRVEVRALDRSYLQLLIPDASQPPQITLEQPDKLPPRIAACVVTVWMDETLDNLEFQTRETATALHAALNSVSTVTFDARRHLDLVGDGPAPTLQAVVVIQRRAEIDRDTFIQRYRVGHIPLAKALQPKFTRYTTFRVLESIGEFSGDCITLQEYPSLDAIRQHMSLRAQVGDQASDDMTEIAYRIVYYVGERTLG